MKPNLPHPDLEMWQRAPATGDMYTSLATQFESLVSMLRANASDDEDEEDLDEESMTRAIRPMSQSLDMPLLNTGLVRLDCALTGKKGDPRLASRVSIRPDESFIDHVRKAFPGIPIRIWAPATTVELIQRAEDHGRLHPVKVHTPAAEDLFLSWWTDQCSAIAGPVPPDVVISTATECARGAFRQYEKMMAGVRRRIEAGDTRPIKAAAGGVNWIVTRDRVAACDPEYGVLVATTPFVWCVHDALRARFFTHLGIDVFGPVSPLPSHVMIQEMWDWQRAVVRVYGNVGHEIAKAPEAICKTLSSRLSGGSYAFPDAFDRMVEKIRQKEVKAGLPEDSRALIHDLVVLLEEIPDYRVVLEMGGLIKCFGFPIIDPITSGESSRDFGRAPDRTRPHREHLSEWLLCHLLLINYIKKHGVWPPIRFSSTETGLKRLHHKGWLSVTWTSYDLSDWACARFLPFLEFDYHENYLPLLKDKSCSVLRSQLQATYDGTLPDRSIRRLLKMALDQERIDTRALLNQYARNEVSRDEYMILEYPKLKEFKVAARMFCMLTMRMRLIFSIIQENVKHGLFQYLPYTSMTMSKAELERELLRMTSPAARGETLFIEVDLSRWNLCFRDAVCNRLGGVMDDVFGVNNTFGRFHEFCRQSEVMVLVGDSRVKTLEAGDPERRLVDQLPNYFTNHLGGFEGIDQATWTTATICMLQQALMHERVSFKLLGQGDNQTLAIRRNPGNTEPMETMAARIMASIDEVCDEMNHEAKPDEFVDSLSQLTYSKNAYVAGASVPQELKALSRVAPITATDICTFGDSIGALFSGTVGSSSNSRAPERHWLIGMMMAELQIQDARRGWAPFPRSHTDPIVGHDDLQRTKLILAVPSVLGGLPVSPVSSYLCRAEPDPLTTALACLRSMARTDPHLRGYLGVLEAPALYQSRPRLDSLLRDPYSLPFHTSPLPTSVIADAALGMVRQSRNTHIRELLGETDRQSRDEFVTGLMSTRPCFPTVLRDLYDVSAHGKLDEMAKMFTLTRTFVGSVKGDSGKVDAKIWDAERKRNLLIGMRLRLGCLAPQRLLRPCLSHELADQLRLRWGLGPGTIQGLSCAHPFDNCPVPGASGGSGVRFVTRWDVGDGHQTRGPIKPYLGSRTMERRVEKEWDVRRTPAGNEIKRLILGYSAAEVDEAVTTHYRYALAQRTAEPLESLLTTLPTIQGGILAHRYQSLRDAGGIRPNGNPMISTHTSFSSDFVQGISGGQDDYPVAFQQWFAIGLGLSRIAVAAPIRITRSFRLPLTAAQLSPLKESRLTATAVTRVPVTLPDNPLLYIRELEAVSAGHRPGREETISEGMIRDDPEVADAALSSILTILVLKKPISATRLELDEESMEESSRPLVIDLAVIQAMGVVRVYSAVVRAICAAGPRFYMRTIGKTPTRFSLYSLCYSLAGILLPIISTHHQRVDMSGLISTGAWTPGSSQAALATARASLRRVMAGDAFSQLSLGTPGRSRMIVPPTTAHITELEVLAVEISTVLFAVVSVHDDTSMGEGKRALRDMVMTLRAATSTTLEALATREVLIAGLYDVLASSPTFGMRQAEIDVLSWLAQPTQAFSCPLETALRALRHPTLKSIPRVLGRQDLFRDPTGGDSSGLLAWHDERTDGLKAQSPMWLSELPARDPWDLFTNGGTRVVGYTTRSGSYWSEVVERVRGPALVIGTGAGGIQAALAAVGIDSRGLDFQATIDAILGDGEGVPPELTACGLPGATWSSAMFSHSGDMFDPECLSEALGDESFQTVIVDIEPEGPRPGLSILSSLVEANFVGDVWMKLAGTREEVSAVWAALSETTGCRRISCYQMTVGTPDDRLHQYAVGVSLSPTVRIPQEYTPRGRLIGTRVRFPLPSDIPRWTATLPGRIRAVCGQFVDSGTLSFRDAQAQLAVACLEAQGDHRGGVSGSIFMGMIRSWAIATIGSELTEEEDLTRALERLGELLSMPGMQVTQGGLSVYLDFHEARVRQSLVRRMPHALAIWYLEQPI